MYLEPPKVLPQCDLRIIPLEVWIKKANVWTSLMAQWIRVCLPMQVTQVPSLIWENPTCCRATNPCVTTAEAHVLTAHAPQQEKPPEWGASVPK